MTWGEALEILIVKIAALGDVVMALTMLPAIEKHYPQARVTWLTAKQTAPLVQATGKVHQVIAVDEEPLLAGNRAQKIEAMLRLWIDLAGRRFDLIVTAHPDPRYRWLTRPLAAAERRGFSRRQGQRPFPVPGRYHGDEYARLITGEEGPAQVPSVLPSVPVGLSETVRAALATLPVPVVALAPGGAKNILSDVPLKRWPLSHYAELARRLLAQGCGVVLTGAASDLWVQEGFAGLDVLNLIGKTSVMDLVGLYAACDAVVTHDSGPLHLARLAGAPLVALFGPTAPAEFIRPDARTVVLWGGAHLPCRPCYDGRRYADCHDNVCMQSVTPGQVEAEVMQLAGRAEVRPGSRPSTLRSQTERRTPR